MVLRLTIVRKVLFILTAMAFTGGPAASVRVQQLSALNLTEGNTAIMTCTYENSLNWHCKARWTKNSMGPISVDLENPEYNGRLNLSNLSHNNRWESTLSISDVRGSDSGTYYCEIEVTDRNKTGLIKKGNGAGTKLRVIDDPTGIRSHDLTVSSLTVQQPPALTVTTGGTAVMMCTFENNMRRSARALWTRKSTGNTSVDVNNTQYSGRLTMSTQVQIFEGKAIINISDVKGNDSDIYYCEIDIFEQNTDNNLKGKGNGTQLTVTEDRAGRRNQAEAPAKDNTASNKSSALLYWILPPLAVIFLAVVISAIIYLRKESSGRQLDAQMAAPTMAETEDNLQYAQINLRKMHRSAPPTDNTLYARLNLGATVSSDNAQKDNILYAQLNLLQTEVT